MMAALRGPTDVRLPVGFRVRLDRRARRLAVRTTDGAALLGGSPLRLLHLAPAARQLLAGKELTVRDATSAALARRLVDAGLAHPVPGTAPAPGTAEVTVVIPVKDRPDGLRRLLGALPSELAEIVVVDDGSAAPAGTLTVADSGGARVLRHARCRGPAAARNTGLSAARTPLVVFLDSDVVPEPGWLGPLLEHLADPAVALVAPRIVALTGDPSTQQGWLACYEATRSSLDLGPDPAPIVPRSRVAYVPSAALLVRRAALGHGFDEAMAVAEDVDLELRLHEAGWRLRYEPAARVGHDHRTSLGRWWTRKVFYGTGAGPLAQRHPGAVPPLVLSPWAAIAVGLLLVMPRRLGLPGAAAVSGLAALRLSRQLRRLRRPRRTAARLVGRGLLGTLWQVIGALTRHYWPLTALGCVLSSRVRRLALAAVLVDGVADWVRHRGSSDPRLDPLRYLLARRLDDLGYGAGLWWGAGRLRTIAPLRPVIRSSRAARPRCEPTGGSHPGTLS